MSCRIPIATRDAKVTPSVLRRCGEKRKYRPARSPLRVVSPLAWLRISNPANQSDLYIRDLVTGITSLVSVNSTGVVGLTFYDFRNLQAGNKTTLPTDYWFKSSTNGGASFGNEVHLAGPFDMLTAPNAGGFFVGDYEGIGIAGTTFRPFFVAANSGNTSNRTDVFTTVVP